MGIMMIAGTERRRQGCSLQAFKQWGYKTVHGTNPVTYDLPIPFEEAPFTVAISTGNSGNHASCGGFTKTTIVLRAGTTAGVWDTVGFFIVGCQLQWGFTNTKTKIVLPISIKTLYGFFVAHHSKDMIPDAVSVYIRDGIANLKTVADDGTDFYLIIGI